MLGATSLLPADRDDLIKQALKNGMPMRMADVVGREALVHLDEVRALRRLAARAARAALAIGDDHRVGPNPHGWT